MTVLKLPPILCHKEHDKASVFVPENLLREARRQRSIPIGKVPEICVLDPDGDIVRNLLTQNKCSLNPHWACYHSKLYNFELDGIIFGIVGCAVGSSFAVLVAEELFSSGCQLLINITSAGQILPVAALPCFIVIEKALRDEGTSYHYLPASEYCEMDGLCLNMIKDAFCQSSLPVFFGVTWTTDAPFRETAAAIESCRKKGICAVEMEAAALYAFSKAKKKDLICFAHVTNEMGKESGDFEKGVADGSKDALAIISVTATKWLSTRAAKLEKGG
ncbi:MAG: uridine phosphorylase [Omnitrophica bacterium RIFCSPHIGHO2_12_FULL_44_12]|nr:MAG: uridine phosphorylase [Omnitrophica bacterium RIFCSPHIGHO2_12_FULL_44_12]